MKDRDESQVCVRVSIASYKFLKKVPTRLVKRFFLEDMCVCEIVCGECVCVFCFLCVVLPMQFKDNLAMMLLGYLDVCVFFPVWFCAASLSTRGVMVCCVCVEESRRRV